MPPEKTIIDSSASLLDSWPVIGPVILFVLTAAGTFWAKLSGKASREELASAIQASREEMVDGFKGIYRRINEVNDNQQTRLTDLERYISDKLLEQASRPNKRKDD